MKKVFLISNGGYEDVTAYEKLPKWDWAQNPVFEGWLLKSDHGIVTKDSPNGASVYTVLHKLTKERYHIWGGTVLNDRLDKVGNLTDIRVSYLGIPPGKKYKNFKVEQDKDAVFNPADYPNIDVTVRAAQAEKVSGYQEVKKESTNASTKERYVSEDDLPF